MTMEPETGAPGPAASGDEQWAQVRARLRAAVGEAAFNSWLRPLTVSTETGGGVRVAVTGAGASVFRVAAMEAALSANWSAAALDGIAVSADGLNTDIHAAADYRAHLVTVMAKRAVEACG